MNRPVSRALLLAALVLSTSAVEVASAASPPSISPFDHHGQPLGQTRTLPFTVGNPNGPATDLKLQATIENDLVSPPNLFFQSTSPDGAHWNLVLTPTQPTSSELGTLAVKVSDSAGLSSTSSFTFVRFEDPGLPAVLGGGTAISLNAAGLTDASTRHYAMDAQATDFSLGNQATIEAWVFATQLPDVSLNVVATIGSPSNTRGMILAIQRDGSPSFANWANDFYPTNAQVKITTNRWHHVAATVRDAKVSLYVDGHLSASGTLTRPVNLAARYLIIGHEPFEDNLDRPWYGFLDNIRFWNIERSAADIASSSLTAVPPDAPGLVRDFRCDVGFVHFDGANPALATSGVPLGGMLRDSSAHQRPAALQGFPHYVSGVSLGTTINVLEDASAQFGLGAAQTGVDVTGTAGSIRSIYFGPITSNIGDGLGQSPGWPDLPDLVIPHTAGLEVPPGGQTGYGQRFQGWLLPPASGEYKVAIASANDGQLWISSDDQPAHLALAATSPASGVSFRRFDFDPARQTATVNLVAGQRYYFEVRHQAGKPTGGGPHLSVQWTMPGGWIETPIPAHRMQPVGPTTALDPNLTFTIDQQPAAGTLAVQNGVATYRPQANYFGTDSFIYRAAYNAYTSAPVLVNLNVANRDDAPVAGSGNALHLGGGTATAYTENAFNLRGSSFTLELWARRDSTNPPAADMSEVLWELFPDEFNQNNSQAAFAWLPDSTIALYLAPLGPQTPLIIRDPYLDTDWHHWAFVYDATTGSREVFRDGASVGQDITTNSPLTLVHLNLGSALLIGDKFQGSVDEVRLWTRTRTGDELAATMRIPLTGHEDGLFAYHRLDDNNGLLARDSSLPKPGGLNLDLTLTDPVTWISGVTNLSVVSVPRNSLGQKIFLPGSDLEGQPVTWQILSPTPRNGTLRPDLLIAGAYTYVPNSNYYGLDPIQYQVTAGGKTSAVAMVQINVTQQPVPPPVIAPLRDAELEEEDPPLVIPISLADADDPTGASLTLTARSSNPSLLPVGSITFQGSGTTRTATLTPLEGEVGTSRIEVEVRNTDNQSAVASFELRVNPRLAYAVVNAGETTGRPSSFATALNQSGQLAGWVANTSGATNSQPFFYAGFGAATPSSLVDNLGGSTGGALALNNAGRMVGATASAQGASRAFSIDPRQDTVPTDLGLPPGANTSVATAINDAGLIAGYAQLGDGTFRAFTAGPSPIAALALTNGYTGMWATAVNDAGEVAGYARVGANNATNGFLYALGQTLDLGRPDGANQVIVTAVNNEGTVFGHAFYPASATSSAVRWENGSWTHLGDVFLGGRTEVAGANRYGQFVGRALDTNGVWRAFLHTDGRAFDLNRLLPSDSGWHLMAATAINDLGQIAATGSTTNGIPQALLLFPATEIGRRVFRPEGTLAELPQITILQGGGHDQSGNSFFWSAGDRKLFAIRPVVAELRWHTGTYSVVTNLTEFGDTFIRQKFTNEVLLPTLSFNVWPADPDLHVAGAPVQVEPQQPGFQHGFVELSYSTVDGAQVDGATKVFTSPSPGWSVLHYLKTGGLPPNAELQSHEFKVARSIAWNDPSYLVTGVPWTIGESITNALHNDYAGLNGFVFHANSPYDGLGQDAAHHRATRSGPIVPVNTHTNGGDLVVVWYRQNRLGVAWPNLPYQYALHWPTHVPTLVIASLQGSGPLSEADYPQMQIYQQADPAQPGYNPNEEHALFDNGALYALRNDLNAVIQPRASDPYVLLKHRDPVTSEWRFKVYGVTDEQAPYFFRYEGVAGEPIQPPAPLSALPITGEANRVFAGPAWKDVHGQFYARAAGLDGGEGDVVLQWFYPLRSDFFYDLNRDGQPDADIGAPVPWLDRRPGGITGDPVNLTYAIEWPAQVPPLQIGQSLTTATGGLPDITDMAAARVIFDSLDPAGSRPVNAAARLFDPLSPRTVDLDPSFVFPARIQRSADPTTGLESFPDLPYVLRVRLFHDPGNRLLGFRGYIYSPPDGGNPITLVNIMSSREQDTIAALDLSADGAAFRTVVGDLYQKTRNPNDVDTDGDGSPDEALLIGLTSITVTNQGVVTNRVVRETLLGPKALSAGQPVPPLSAPTSYAVHFDGQSAAMRVGPVFANITNSFTIEFWVRPEASLSTSAEETSGKSGQGGQLYAVFPTQGGIAYGAGHAGAGVSVGTNGIAVFIHTDNLIASPLVYPTNLVGWHHVAVVYQQQQPILYLDGSLVRVGLASTQVLHPSADLSSDSTSSSYGPFPGSITDLRVWDYARSFTEIAANLNQHLTGAEEGLAGLWRFDENTGTNVVDATSANRDGTLIGGAAWTSNAPPRAPAIRYVVIAENDDPALPGLPVDLHVIRIDDTLASGALAIIQSDNALDERVTLRHTADFAGQPETFVFEWFYQFDTSGFDPSAVPDVTAEGGAIPGAWNRYFTAGTGINDITLGATAQSGLLTLSDTWWIMRYGVTSGTGVTNWSGWVGDPAGTDAAPRAMLVPGWIKRVLGGINLFAQRSSDFEDNSVNTLASTLAEAGPGYRGDVALNPSVLDNFGLIEIYETVLRRGRTLSIDGSPAIDFQPADDALLLAAGRIAELYLLHANEAFADAADPTIGLTTDSTELGSVASSIFAFENQLDSLIEEELALLRGRDDRSGGVGAYPVFNRLLWNFTGSEGEVAYVAAYGIPDQNGDGFINAADARILYPQGHGDAWGHYLSALTSYYDLLRHPHFTWVPRSQSTLVAGIPIDVNYQDERQFAVAAAAKARTGAEIVDRTWRLDYTPDLVAQFQGDSDPNPARAWSPTDWARRASLGAYFDWITGNAILPPIDPDPTHTGIQRVDRTTVLDLVQIVTEAGSVVSVLDRADAGLSPAGLAPGTVPFDMDPDRLSTGFSRVTHFEQVYERALQSLHNAEVAFNRASALSSELRQQQNSVSDFSVAVADQEQDFKNQLISIFGYPHAGNLGAGRPYPAAYDGPDLTFWSYVDTLDITPENNPRSSGFLGLQTTFTRLTADWGAAFSADITELLDSTTNRLIEVEFPVSTADYAFQAPASWGKRRAEGQLQANLRALVLSQAQLRQALGAYGSLITALEEQADLMDLRYGLRRDQIHLLNSKSITMDTFNAALLAAKTTKIVLDGATDNINDATLALAAAVPDVEGLSNDFFGFLRGLQYLLGSFAKSVPQKVSEGAEIAENALDFAKDFAELEIDRESETKAMDFEMTENLKQLESLVRQEPALRRDLFNANQAILQAARDLEATRAEGERLLVQRTIFRQITAGTIQADRYRDLGLRIFRNDALQKYEAQFDLAARYVHLAAAAYDYELNLGTDSGAGSILGTQIVRERSLGELADGQPVVGRVGLASVLGRLRQNFDVLKAQLGLNNDRQERVRFSLRTEAFRLLPVGTNETSTGWHDLLQRSVVSNLWDVAEFRRHCRPFAPEAAGPQPGIVLRFGTTISPGRNYFDQPLCSLDSSYDPSEFATRIKSLAVWLTDYDTAGLSARPRVYLVPVGTDRMRAAEADDFTIHDWQVLDQRIPVPFPITDADLAAADHQPIVPGADGTFTELRRHSAFRAYQDAAFDLDEFNESSRLVGRSVWNTQWVLIIPGAYLLGDAQDGIDRLVNSISDIKLYFQTYSLSGN